MPSSMLNLAALQDTPLRHDPFDHVVVPDFVPAEDLRRVMADFPAVDSPGSYPLHALRSGGAFSALTDILQGEEMTAAISKKGRKADGWGMAIICLRRPARARPLGCRS